MTSFSRLGRYFPILFGLFLRLGCAEHHKGSIDTVSPATVDERHRRSLIAWPFISDSFHPRHALPSSPQPAHAQARELDVAYCVVGQERSFASPVVWTSLRRNVIYAVNASLAKAAARVAAGAFSASTLQQFDRSAGRAGGGGRSGGGSAGGGFKVVGGDVFAVIKVERANVAEVRRVARRLGAQNCEVIRHAAARDESLLAQRNNPRCPLLLLQEHSVQGRVLTTSGSRDSGGSSSRRDEGGGGGGGVAMTAGSQNGEGFILRQLRKFRSKRALQFASSATTTTSSGSSGGGGGGGGGSGEVVRALGQQRLHGQRQPPADSMRRRFAVVSVDQARCFELVEKAEQARGGRRFVLDCYVHQSSYTHVMKLRSDQQVCAPLGGRVLWPALHPTHPRIVKQRDHWAFVPRSLAAVYFNASHEVLSECHSRQAYDRFPVATGTRLHPSWLMDQAAQAAAISAAVDAAAAAAAAAIDTAIVDTDTGSDVESGGVAEEEEAAASVGGGKRFLLATAASPEAERAAAPTQLLRRGLNGVDDGNEEEEEEEEEEEGEKGRKLVAARPPPVVHHRCHWQSRAHPNDVPNECLLDHWLASHGVPFVEALLPTCIRKKPTAAGEACPSISFNQNSRLDTSKC